MESLNFSDISVDFRLILMTQDIDHQYRQFNERIFFNAQQYSKKNNFDMFKTRQKIIHKISHFVHQ